VLAITLFSTSGYSPCSKASRQPLFIHRYAFWPLSALIIVTVIRPRVVRVPLMLVMLIGWAFELSILDLNGAVSNQDQFCAGK
jgi:hypothetical protein